VRMTVCFMEQQIQARVQGGDAVIPPVGDMMQDIETLLGKIR